MFSRITSEIHYLVYSFLIGQVTSFGILISDRLTITYYTHPHALVNKLINRVAHKFLP